MPLERFPIQEGAHKGMSLWVCSFVLELMWANELILLFKGWFPSVDRQGPASLMLTHKVLPV